MLMTLGITGFCPLLANEMLAKVEAIDYCTFIGFLKIEIFRTLD